MKSDGPHSKTKPSNRLSHGLSSRARAECWLDEIKQLADELASDAPDSLAVKIAARDLARTFYLLKAIRAERTKLLSTPSPPRVYCDLVAMGDFDVFRQEVVDSGFCKDPPATKWASNLVDAVQYVDRAAAYVPTTEGTLHLLISRRKELSRVDEYERKALSRLRKQIMLLDYVRLEIKRQKHAELIKQLRGRMSQT